MTEINKIDKKQRLKKFKTTNIDDMEINEKKLYI